MADETYSVQTTHKDYNRNLPKWKLIRSVLASECRKYLRNVGRNEPDPKYGKARQDEYEEGAIFYGFTSRTLAGMVGAVTRKSPEVILPPEIEYLLDNINGAGVGLVQHAADTLREIDSISRGGLLADAPNVEAANMADQNEGRLNPTIAFYTAENIINWRIKRVGSIDMVQMVVLKEQYEYQPYTDDEFTFSTADQYRVLDFDENGYYRQRLYKFDDKGAMLGEVILIEPKKGSGERYSYIPFMFIGAVNNDWTVDDPVLYDMAVLNIGHYRNSADNEESSFIVGQPTLFISPGQNMSLEQFGKANPQGVKMGSRTGHNIGAGGTASLIQAGENNLAKQNMRDKEEQALQIGAQLITPSVQITAESARLQRAADTSIMANVANNVSAAYETAIGWCADMLSVTGEIVFELNTEFFMTVLTAQDRAQWVADINAGLLPARAYYAALRNSGQTNWTDEEIETELENVPVQSTTVIGEPPQVAQQNNNQSNQE